MKIYSEIHLKTGFIKPFKSLPGILILFNKKSDGSFWVYVNYWGQINLKIKIKYPLPLIAEALCQLGRA